MNNGWMDEWMDGLIDLVDACSLLMLGYYHSSWMRGWG